MGLEVDEFVERERRFHGLLVENQRTDVVRATQTLIDAWTAADGGLMWGGGADTSCFLLTRDENVDGPLHWALVLYPSSGRAEVVFQHMSRRPPFDDVTLRRELLHRFNAISGIDLPGDSLNRRPSFPLQSLVGEGGKHTLDVCCGSVSVARRGCPSDCDHSHKRHRMFYNGTHGPQFR